VWERESYRHVRAQYLYPARVRGAVLYKIMQTHPHNTNINRGHYFLGTLYDIPATGTSLNFCSWQPPRSAEHEIIAARWSHEICPTTGRYVGSWRVCNLWLSLLQYSRRIWISFSNHIQIFLRTRGQHRYQGINTLLGIGRGNDWRISVDPHAAWNYCGEEKEDPSSRHGCASQCIGSRPRPTARRGGPLTITERSIRLGVLREGLIRGDSLSTLARDEQCFELFIKHPSGIKFVQQLLSTPKNTPEVIRNS